MDINALFPIPLATGYIDSKNFALLHDLTQEELAPRKGDTHGDVSANTKLLSLDKYRSLESEIASHVGGYANTILGEHAQEWKSSISWVSVKYPGQWHEKHHHPNSMISTVLWFGEVNKHTPAIEFHHPKSDWGWNPIFQNKPDFITDYTATSFTIPVEHGLLAIFPSWLPHSVPINETDHPRYSLAANWVPRKGVGHGDSLTRLDWY